MFFVFILMLPFLEVYVFFKLATEYGWLNMFLFLFGSAIFGLYTIKRASFFIQPSSLNQPNQIGKQALTMLAGILFLIPGFVTDFFAVLLLFPPTQMLIGLLIQNKILKVFKNGSVKVFQFGANRFEQNNQNSVIQDNLIQDDIIDVTPVSSKKDFEK
jgi:UPF0716 protein FxsA